MTGLISVDENLKEAHVESRRIMGILNRLREETSERQILNLYHKFMMERHQQGRNSLRSVRLSLHPASQILLMALEKKVSPPNQKIIEAYLKNHPGQRNASTSFLNFLRKNDKSVEVPKKRKNLNSKKK